MWKKKKKKMDEFLASVQTPPKKHRTGKITASDLIEDKKREIDTVRGILVGFNVLSGGDPGGMLIENDSSEIKKLISEATELEMCAAEWEIYAAQNMEKSHEVHQQMTYKIRSLEDTVRQSFPEQKQTSQTLPDTSSSIPAYDQLLKEMLRSQDC